MKKEINENELEKVNGGIKITSPKLIEKMKELIQKIMDKIKKK